MTKKNLITKEFIKIVFLSAIYSTIINVVLLVLVKGPSGAPESFAPFTYTAVIGASILCVLLAGVVYLLISKFSNKNLVNWTVISLIALMISFIPDVLLPLSNAIEDQGSNPIIILILMIMHVAPAWFVIVKFNKYTREQAERSL